MIITIAWWPQTIVTLGALLVGLGFIGGVWLAITFMLTGQVSDLMNWLLDRFLVCTWAGVVLLWLPDFV